MTPFLIQYKNKSYRVSGSKGTYKIKTFFLARTQPAWYLALQKNYHVVQVKNDDCNNTSEIIFTLSEHQEDKVMEDLGELAASYIL